ncbi:MAG: flagellar motor switch protein FliG [Zhongshania sp.]|jgi:flagellar motor switch protein FliG
MAAIQSNTIMPSSEQAAALLMSLDKADAAAVMRAMAPNDLHRLALAMKQMDAPGSLQFGEVLQRFHQDVLKFSGVLNSASEGVQSLFTEALGEERAKLLGERSSFFQQSRHVTTLQWLDAATIAAIVRREHPQIQTVLIACLEAAQASEVLLEFDAPRRLDLLGRLAILKTLSQAALEELEWLLDMYFSGAGRSSGRRLGGEQKAADLLNQLDVVTESLLLNGLRTSRPEAAARIEDLMFGFEQLDKIASADLRLLLGQLSDEVIAAALAGSHSRQRECLVAVLDDKQLRAVKALARNYRPVEMEMARTEIVTIAKHMAAVGEIILDARKINVF